MKKDTRFYVSIAEIVSAVAIVISLIYAGFEFRRSQTLSGREVDVILFERVMEANKALYESPHLADIVVMATDSPDVLSKAQRLRYLVYQHNFFDTWELAWIYHRDDVLDDDSWREWDDWFAGEARRRPRFGWIENQRHFTSLDFRRHVDSALAVDDDAE